MDDDLAQLEQLMETGDFSGVVAIGQPGSEPQVLSRGMADRAEQRAITPTTRFGIASGTKGFTAVTTVSLIEDGLLAFDTPVVEITGDDLPDIDPTVTVEHLLGHRSGIGDYIDETLDWHDDDHTVDVAVHTLERPGDYVPILANRPQVFSPGSDFAYNNSGFVVLSVIIDRVAPEGFHDAVRQRVFGPAAMTSSDFFRADNPPPDLAVGYLTDGRTNLFHMPVIGAGDGGAQCTGGDILAFWSAFLGGRLVSPDHVEQMTAVRSRPSDHPAYGLGFWLDDGGAAAGLVGCDPGVSFRSSVDRTTGRGWAILANTSTGAWPLARHLAV